MPKTSLLVVGDKKSNSLGVVEVIFYICISSFR